MRQLGGGFCLSPYGTRPELGCNLSPPVTRWDQLEKAFLAKYFPPSKTAYLRSQITKLRQRDGDTLSETWDRFKELLRVCPHHGLAKWLLVQTFYDSLTYNTRISLDASAGGALMNLLVDDAYNLIENMALNQHSWTSERRGTAGKHEVDEITLLNAKVEALQRELGRKNNSTVGSAMYCEIFSGDNHTADECQLGKEMGQEEVNMVNNSFRPQNNPYSNTYNPGWRNHPNFSYKNTQGAAPQQGFNQNRPQQGFPPKQIEQQPAPKSNLETMIENLTIQQERFIASQTKKYEEYDGKFNMFEGKFNMLSNQMKMLETQVTQIAQQVSTITRPHGAFPGQPEVNPREQCKAITLRSGLAYDEPPMPQEEGEGATKTDQTDQPEKGANQFKPETQAEKGQTEKEGEKQQSDKSRYDPPPYKPPVPYPQRLVKAKMDKQFGKFLDTLKKLHITIPFTD